MIGALAPTASNDGVPPDGLVEHITEAMANAYRGDTVGFLLGSQLFMNTIAQRLFPNVECYLNSVQKVGNEVYVQSRTTVRDVETDSGERKTFYITSERILISTSDSVYSVSTFVPDTEPVPRSASFLRVNEWLGDFAVILQ
jgi:hypothetical protein